MQETPTTIVVKDIDVIPESTVRRVAPTEGTVYTRTAVARVGPIGFLLHALLVLLVIAVALPLLGLGLVCFLVAVPIALIIRALRR